MHISFENRSFAIFWYQFQRPCQILTLPLSHQILRCEQFRHNHRTFVNFRRRSLLPLRSLAQLTLFLLPRFCDYYWAVVAPRMAKIVYYAVFFTVAEASFYIVFYCYGGD